MNKEERSPHGIIYIATNSNNGKNYVGKTKKTPEERWQVHLDKAQMLENIRESNPHTKIRGTHLNNAIIKYGNDAFIIKQIDVAYSRDELNEKERYYVKEYDSMNPDKGYNMTEGGEGGRPRPEVIERMTEISRERAKDPKWLDKMAEVNQEIGRNPETQGKISESLSEKWQEKQYQDNVSMGATNKWQEAKHRDRQFTARRAGKREIPDKGEFLRDIQDMKKKDINTKYDMDGKSINVRINEMLGHHGVKNYSEAKKYLENKNLDNVLKDINEKLNERPNEFKGKKEISNTREFLEDIQNIQAKEIAQKYDMNRSTVNKRIREMLGDKGIKNYTEAKKYLQDKNLDDVVKGIDEKLKDQSHITEGKTIISNKKEFLKDIQELQKNEIDQKYGMDAKTVNNKIKELLGEHGVKNYTGAKEYLKDKNLDEVLKDINNKSGEKQDNPSEGTNKESKEETHEDSKQEEAKDEKQSEEKSKNLNDRESEESVEEKPKESSEETTEVSTEENKDEGKEETTEPQSEESQGQVSEESTNISDRKEEQLKTADRKMETKYLPGQEPKEKRDREKKIHPYILTSGKEQRRPDPKRFKDYDGIDESPGDKKFDYDGIDTPSEDDKSDIKSLDGEFDEQGNDYDGIDDPQEDVDKDYDKLDESYGEGGSEG